MELDGSNQRRLTNNPLRDEMPAWSPDGQRIAFSSEHDDGMEIYTMNVDGSGRTRLTTQAGNDWYPTWSPDGKTIAWMRQGVNTGEIWLMNADGSNQRPLLGPTRFLNRPRWSPDGRYLAFSYFPRTKELGRIGIIQSDGANFHELACDTAAPTENHVVGAWAPDGSALYYTRYFLNEKGQLIWSAVWAMPIANGNCSGGWGDQIQERRVKALTDMKDADPQPPLTALQPLPAYSRLPSLLVRLNGKDQGRSGLESYDVEYRPGYNLAWQKGREHTVGITTIENPPVGKIFLRSRARDQAGNVEAWPSSNEGEASTTLYRWLVQGRLTDQRGLPLAQQPVAFNPAPVEESVTDLDGYFLARLGDGTSFTLNNTMQLSAGTDWTRPLYQAPTSNLLRNGDFEAATLTDWRSSGALIPQLSNEVIYNGKQSLRLGATCVGLCPAQNLPEFPVVCIPNVTPGCPPPNTGAPSYVLRPVSLFVDQNNNLHFFGFSQQNESIYQHGRPDAAWDAPIKLDDNAFVRSVAFGKEGDLHIAWSGTPQGGTVFYRKRAASGTWSATQPVSSGSDPKLAVDSQGLPHLLYLGDNPYPAEKQSLHYRAMQANGAWSEQRDLGVYPFGHTSLTTLYSDIVITPDDRVHLVWGEPEGDGWVQAYRLVYQIREPNGSWLPKSSIHVSANLEALRLFSTAQGNLHLFWMQDGIGYYATKPAGDVWSTPEAVGRFDLVARDRSDILYLFDSPAWNKTGSYRYKLPQRAWSDPYPMVGSMPMPQLAAVSAGATGTLHALWQRDISSTPYYASSQPVTTSTDSQIQQTLALPPTLHRPTLSFMAAFDGGATDASYLEVVVSNGVTATQVFSSSRPSPWLLHWVEMTPWLGETVTVTFNLHQAANDLPVRAYIDDLTLTPWLTPVTKALSPQQLEVGIATTLIISGENFIATPTVKVEETVLANVQQVDDQALRVDLPATLLPGRYRVWVRNPGSVENRYAGQIQVGKAVYLPTITR